MNTIVQWLDGRKTTIAAVAGVILAWVQSQHWIDDNTAMMIAGLLTIWTGVGIAHKVNKGSL